MQTRHAFSWIRSAMAGLALMVFLLVGCGGGGGGETLGPDLGGTVNTAVFTIPAGTRQNVTSNLVVNATQKIDIAGTMVVKPGVSVALFSDDEVSISGTVESESTATSRGSAGRARNGTDNFIAVGAKTTVEGKLKLDKPIYACGFGQSPTLTVSGSIVTLDGLDGKDTTDSGDDAADIELSTVVAKAAAEV